MESVLITPRDKKELILVKGFLEKMNIAKKILSDTEKEDVALLNLMLQEDRNDLVSEKKYSKSLEKMEVKYLSSFSKDLKKIKNKEILFGTEKIINDIKASIDSRKIKNVKKLKGHNFAYRIKIKDFRIGIFIENNIVEFVRILPRKDIYESFP